MSGPISVLICISEFEDDITYTMLTFLDDTKVFRNVIDNVDKQNDLSKLSKWSEIWQILFNVGEVKCI